MCAGSTLFATRHCRDDRARRTHRWERNGDEALNSAIRELPDADRALVLLYLDEVPYRDMAQILGLTESNVGVRLNRIRRRLAESMTGETK